MAGWQISDIEIAIEESASGGSVATIRVRTPLGELLVMGAIEAFGHEVVLAGVHIQSESLRPNMLGWGKVRQWRGPWRRKPMSMLSLLRERFGQPEPESEDFRVKSGSPARYELQAEAPIVKSISAIKVLARRHVPLIVAKRQVEALMAGRDVAIDVPVLEDSALFESELRELGIRATRISAAAAAEG